MERVPLARRIDLWVGNKEPTIHSIAQQIPSQPTHKESGTQGIVGIGDAWICSEGVGYFGLWVSQTNPLPILNWVRQAGPPVGAQPKNAGGSVSNFADLQPTAWIRCPVKMSSVIDP